jgi:hypothetical protein
MNHKALFVAGAIILAPAAGLASSHGVHHPAMPDAHSPEPAHVSPFAATIPLLDRAAPNPSHWPAPEGAGSARQEGMQVGQDTDHGGGMGHSGMSHGSMSQGEASAPLQPVN